MIEIEDVRQKETEKRAEEYLNRIFYGVEAYRRIFPHKELTVFMSLNILACLNTQCHNRWEAPMYSPDGIITVCGCKVKQLIESDLLYVGYEI